MKLKKYIAHVFVMIGFVVCATAFAADLIGLGGQSGFGPKQMLLGLAGALIILFGVSLAIPASRMVYDRLLHPTLADQNIVDMDSVQKKLVVIAFMTAWYGLTTGYAEAILRFVQKYVFGRPIFLSKQFIWMIPVADLILFCAIGLVMFLVALAWQKAASVGVVAFIFNFFLILSLYYVKPNIAFYAVALLGAGISLQLARFIARRQGGFYQVIQKSLPWGAGLLAVSILISYILVD